MIKVGATGFRTNGEQFASMPWEALDVAVRASHEAGLKIAAHWHGFEGTRLAVGADIDSIEHGTYVDQPTVELMPERGTYMVPAMPTWDARERLATQMGWSRDQMSEIYDRKENSIASFQRALQAGVPIATGTDAGGSPARHWFVAREELMVENGMTPQAALEASTRVAADLLGILDHAGTIEVGKQADMVLIDGDLLSDPAALRNIWAVFQSGRRIR